MSQKLPESIADKTASVKWAAVVIAWCAVCGFVVGVAGSRPDGIARTLVVMKER